MTTVVRRGPLLGIALAALLAFAGCGGDDESSDTNASTSAPAAETTASTPSDDTTSTEDSGGDEGGGSGDDFCTQVMSVQDDITSTPDMTDPNALSDSFRQIRDTLESLDPPSEIEGDWNTITSFFGDFADSFDGVDMSDPESLAGIQDQLADLNSRQAELTEASQNIATWAQEECGIDMDSMTTTP